MSSRTQLVLNKRDVRERARHWIDIAPAGTRVEFKPPQRSLVQNDRMWAMLTDIVVQHSRFNGKDGRKYSTNDAKLVFLHALGVELEILPSLDGKSFIPAGKSSSDLCVREMSDLIDFMFAWGAENNIVWSDPKEQALMKDAEERTA